MRQNKYQYGSSMSQLQQQTQQNTDSNHNTQNDTNTSSGNPSFGISNQQEISQIPSELRTPLVVRLQDIYHWLVEGRLSEAKEQVKMIAAESRMFGMVSSGKRAIT